MSGRQLPICFSTSRVRLLGSQWLVNAHRYSVDRTTTNFFTGSPLSALTTLSFSDNIDLQRSAALAFAEITEKEVRQVGRDTLDPLLFLLSSHDTDVQRAASAALGNLAVNGNLISH
jgi:vacuolar protein 8